MTTHKPVKGASPSPPPSRHSTARSPDPSVNQAYAPIPLSLTPNESNKGDEGEEDDDDDDDDAFFPLPGGLPLLPPTTRHRETASISSKPRSETIVESPSTQLQESSSEPRPSHPAAEDQPLYLLQPRTYTPQLPAPVPSPMLRSSPSPAEPAPLLQRASFLRDRITNPPTSIQIPPTATPDSPLFVPSPNYATPRTTSSMHDLRSPDTAHQQQRPPPRHRIASPLDTPSSDMRTFTPSPFSDHHAFQPVRASPHSPLQQRPHTAAGPQQRPGTGQTAHKPTPLGAMTNMSSVSMARPPSDRGHTPSNLSQHTADRHQLKKKKSAFGWFKKAFTMDEDERAAFESRKAAASSSQRQYYDPNTPRFLDGKRIR